jgi:hypothetical protein
MRESKGYVLDGGDSNGIILWVVTTSFLAAQVFAYLGAEAIIYGTAVVAGTAYVSRRAEEGIWVTFFLIAMTSLMYPISVDVLGEAAVGAFRPYNVVLLSVAGAMVFSVWSQRRRAFTGRARSGTWLIRWIVALAGVFCLATIDGDLSPLKAGALYVLQQSSAWLSFFAFLWIGYKLSLSPSEVRGALTRFHLTALVYSLLFLIKFASSDYYEGLTAATQFAYSQRIALFFAGFAFVLAVASRLVPKAESTAKAVWVSACVLLPAVVLSGSRGILGTVVLTSLLVVMISRGRLLLRLSPLLLTITLLVSLVVLRANYEVIEEYVIAKFVIAPDEDASFLGRVAEMQAVAEAVQRNPVLGSGTLASYTFFDPLFGLRETPFVDNGLGYLLMKTGLLGTAIFSLLVVAWLRLLWSLRKLTSADSLVPIVTLLFYLAFLPFGSGFFDLKYSWLIGIMCGYSLYLAGISGKNIGSWVTEIGEDGNRSTRSYA